MVYQPLISVVITCYNYGKYLNGCLDSVLSQTYKKLEILVVDDGSTDNTAEVINPYLELPNFKYIHQENTGQAHAKNVGVRNATGEFIAFLDADDLWEREKLEKQLVCFEKSKVGVVYCKANYIDEEDNELNFKVTSPYLQPTRGKVTEKLLIDNFVPFSSSMVRAECFEKLGVFDETLKMGIDWDLWLRISTVYQFDFVDERLFSYRVGHYGQMSKNVEMRQHCSDRIMERFLSNYPDSVGQQAIRIACYHTFCTRGNYFRHIDKVKSYGFFFRAIRTIFFKKEAYKGIIKNLIGVKPSI